MAEKKRGIKRPEARLQPKALPDEKIHQKPVQRPEKRRRKFSPKERQTGV